MDAEAAFLCLCESCQEWLSHCSCPTVANRAIDELPQLQLRRPVQLFLAFIERLLAAAELAFLRVQLVEARALAGGELAVVLRVLERVAFPLQFPRVALDLPLLRTQRAFGRKVVPRLGQFRAIGDYVPPPVAANPEVIAVERAFHVVEILQ